MNSYLTQAKRLYHLALTELNESKKAKDEDIASEAAGKAWIATTDALHGFLLSQGLSEKGLPKTERHRHDLLAQYGNKKMRLLYRSIIGEIHQNAYYGGIINYTLLYEAFYDVKEFVHRCENGGWTKLKLLTTNNKHKIITKTKLNNYENSKKHSWTNNYFRIVDYN